MCVCLCVSTESYIPCNSDGSAQTVKASRSSSTTSLDRSSSSEGCEGDGARMGSQVSIEAAAVGEGGTGEVPAGSKGRKGPARRGGSIRKQWTADEEERFLMALGRFAPRSAISTGRTGGGGNQGGAVRLGPGVAEMISMVVGTRSVVQVRSHAQKHFIRLEREALRKRSSAPTSNSSALSSPARPASSGGSLSGPVAAPACQK